MNIKFFHLVLMTLFLCLSLDLQSQDRPSKVTGTLYFETKANMDSYTPTLTRGSELAYVFSTETKYRWSRDSVKWVTDVPHIQDLPPDTDGIDQVNSFSNTRITAFLDDGVVVGRVEHTTEPDHSLIVNTQGDGTIRTYRTGFATTQPEGTVLTKTGPSQFTFEIPSGVDSVGVLNNFIYFYDGENNVVDSIAAPVDTDGIDQVNSFSNTRITAFLDDGVVVGRVEHTTEPDHSLIVNTQGDGTIRTYRTGFATTQPEGTVLTKTGPDQFTFEIPSGVDSVGVLNNFIYFYDGENNVVDSIPAPPDTDGIDQVNSFSNTRITAFLDDGVVVGRVEHTTEPDHSLIVNTQGDGTIRTYRTGFATTQPEGTVLTKTGPSQFTFEIPSGVDSVGVLNNFIYFYDGENNVVDSIPAPIDTDGIDQVNSFSNTRITAFLDDGVVVGRVEHTTEPDHSLIVNTQGDGTIRTYRTGFATTQPEGTVLTKTGPSQFTFEPIPTIDVTSLWLPTSDIINAGDTTAYLPHRGVVGSEAEAAIPNLGDFIVYDVDSNTINSITAELDRDGTTTIGTFDTTNGGEQGYVISSYGSNNNTPTTFGLPASGDTDIRPAGDLNIVGDDDNEIRLGIGNILYTRLENDGTFFHSGRFKDSNGDLGTNGQVLKSLANGTTNWDDDENTNIYNSNGTTTDDTRIATIKQTLVLRTEDLRNQIQIRPAGVIASVTPVVNNDLYQLQVDTTFTRIREFKDGYDSNVSVGKTGSGINGIPNDGYDTGLTLYSRTNNRPGGKDPAFHIDTSGSIHLHTLDRYAPGGTVGGNSNQGAPILRISDNIIDEIDYAPYGLPLTDGTAGQVLGTDGNGQVSWGSAGITHQKFVNVMDHGAVCDGVTNDQISISNALSNFSHVYIPKNKTCVIDQIVLSSKQGFEGPGELLLATGDISSNTSVIRIDPPAGEWAEDIHIGGGLIINGNGVNAVGGDANYNASTQHEGINGINRTRNLVIENVTIKNSGSDAIDLDGDNENTVIRDVKISGFGKSGMHLYGMKGYIIDNVIIDGSSSQTSIDGGIDLSFGTTQGNSDGEIRNVTISNCAYGIRAISAIDLHIDNIKIDDCDRTAFTFTNDNDGIATAGGDVRNITITNGYINNVGDDGINGNFTLVKNVHVDRCARGIVFENPTTSPFVPSINKAIDCSVRNNTNNNAIVGGTATGVGGDASQNYIEFRNCIAFAGSINTSCPSLIESSKSYNSIGVGMSSTHTSILRNNYIQNASSQGMTVSTTGINSVFENNIIIGGSENSIYVNSEGSIARNNIIRDNSTSSRHAIYLNKNNTSAYGNKIINCAEAFHVGTSVVGWNILNNYWAGINSNKVQRFDGISETSGNWKGNYSMSGPSSGIATITAGNTEVTVTHNQGYTPLQYYFNTSAVSAISNLPWIESIGATTFKIKIENAELTDKDFTWSLQ